MTAPENEKRDALQALTEKLDALNNEVMQLREGMREMLVLMLMLQRDNKLPEEAVQQLSEILRSYHALMLLNEDKNLEKLQKLALRLL